MGYSNPTPRESDYYITKSDYKKPTVGINSWLATGGKVSFI